MLNIIKEYRHYIVTLFLAIIPLLALNAGQKKPAELHWTDKAALAISEPVQNTLHWMIEGTWDSIENYLLILNTKSINQEMSLENRKLLNEIASYKEMSLENERLKKLVAFSNEQEGKKITAEVIAQDVSPEFRMIRVNKGSEHGIEKGMAVIVPEGIVGRVLRVSTKYSDILTLLDSSSAVDAIIQRNRARGVIEGLAENLLTMKYLRRTDEIQENDVVISSGIGSIFPKGLVIGKVISVHKKSYGITQQVEVSPSVDFSHLEEVTIIEPVKNPNEEELFPAEKKKESSKSVEKKRR